MRCSHDGYAHLPGRPLHTRSWRFERGSLRVDDEVGHPELPAVARYHLLELAEHEVAIDGAAQALVRQAWVRQTF